jgi:N-acetylglucosamine kinase-like BadF-type ATPase
VGAVSQRRVLVAVDGGGTKTDVLVLDPDGTVLGRARGKDSCPQVIGLPKAVRRLDRSVTSALVEAGRAVGGPVRVGRAGIFLSGLDLPIEIDELRGALAGLPWVEAADGLLVDNDTFALLRAGTPEHQAVAVVCGTGMNCIGRRADGATVRFPAIGAISGDWGGGWELGQQAVWHAARAVDGRGPATTLATLVPAELGRPDMAAVIEDLHRGRLDPGVLPTLAPLLFRAAAAGDPVAGSVVDRQADEIVLLAAAALRRLDLVDDDVPVVLGGGVLAARDPRLVAGIRAGLARVAPRARLEFVTAPPVLGAALLVLEAEGAEAEALARATAALGAA